jgi:transcriptional regulator with XRE-family HTH domain
MLDGMPAAPNRLRATRLQAGLSQAQLAERAGTRQYSVSRWEQGKFPQVPAAIRIAAALDTTVEAVWGDQQQEVHAQAA